MNLSRLMKGMLFGMWSNAATATSPTAGSQSGNPDTVPSKTVDDMSVASSTMAIAAVGKGNPSMAVEILEIEIL